MQSNKQRLGQYAIYTLCFLTVIRLIRDMIVKWTPTIAPGTDLDIYFTGLQALLQGSDPLDPALLGGRISFPGQMILLIPFYRMGAMWGTVAFFFLCAILAFFWFRMVFRQLDLWHPPQSLTLSPQNQLCLLSLCLFFNSPHLKHALYTGQMSQIAFPCLFFAMVAHGVLTRGGLLGLALVAKYSVVPFVGLSFLIIRDFRTCVVAAIVFVAIAALPALYGQDLVSLYTDYFAKVKSTTAQCGIDTYCGGRGIDSQLHFEFFKVNAINLFVKAIFTLLFVTAFWMEYRRKVISLEFLLFANAFTLLIAYHRFYDMPALQLFMIAFLNICLIRRQWKETTIFILFILFSLIVVVWVHAIEYLLGVIVGENSWIYTVSFDRYPLNFPLYAVYIFVVNCYCAYLYFHSTIKTPFLTRNST